MKKYILVYNPVSGDASFRYKLDNVVESFQQKNCVVIPFKLTRDVTNDFILWAKELAVDGIVVSGGDGTIHEIINVMLKNELDLPLGIIPSGTSNDFAKYLQLDKDIDKCVDIIVNGNIKKIDIGKVNDRYFFNVASAGLLTSVAHNADVLLKNTLGKIAYYLKGLGELPNFRALKMKINADGKLIEGDIFLFLVMNSGTVGGFPNMAPNAKINDEKLDLLIVHKCSLPELMSLFFSFIKGVHHNSKHTTYLQAKNICIECDEYVESDLDGEKGPTLPIRITADQTKIGIICI